MVFGTWAFLRKSLETRPPWLTTVILATWEAEIGRIVIPGQPRQKRFQDSILM
jgi:hypothetical protein